MARIGEQIEEREIVPREEPFTEPPAPEVPDPDREREPAGG
jgi:hypothetical protein